MDSLQLQTAVEQQGVITSRLDGRPMSGPVVTLNAVSKRFRENIHLHIHTNVVDEQCCTYNSSILL